MVVNMKLRNEEARRLAVLSNVNLEPVIAEVNNRLYEMHGKASLVMQAAGYGSVFEELLRPDAALYTQGAEHIYLIMDIAELLTGCGTRAEAEHEIGRWFENLRSCLDPRLEYFVSDTDCRCEWLATGMDQMSVQEIEACWYAELRNCINAHDNVHPFPLKRLIERIGKTDGYTEKMWYLGRIPFGAKAREALAEEILQCERRSSVPKKALLLDLDNTLWGGVVGEGSPAELKLGNEKTGLIYKDVQRILKRMQQCGVILGVVSKNNPEDALAVIREHPHMILREEDFAILKINWEPKDQNIREIAAELNLGTDSFVFLDDNPAERALVQERLPEVAVPDFPSQLEQLPAAVLQIFRDYFEKWVYTREDAEKTDQYRANAAREALRSKLRGRAQGKETAGSSDSNAGHADYTGLAAFLKELDIRVKRVDEQENKERLLQLLNKTNQFNLTTIRYTMPELEQILQSEKYRVYLFEVSDRFGNNGITAAVIVSLKEAARIESFVMSCRIMGRLIENMVLDYVEADLRQQGQNALYAAYVYTAKSKPVELFYENSGFTVLSQGTEKKEYQKLLETGGKEWYGRLEKGCYTEADEHFINQMQAAWAEEN